MTQTHHIAVIGAGLMGHGIALTMALSGHSVIVCDPVKAALDTVIDRISDSLTAMNIDTGRKADALSCISTSMSLANSVANAGVVIEAAPEKLDLKRKIFAEIEANTSPETILASNTSVIQITKIMSGLANPERALGTHWWNPPHMIPLVEVIKTEWTRPDVARSMFDLLAGVGKTPVMVEKDVPGFIGNRLQHALWREAISLVENASRPDQRVVASSLGQMAEDLDSADLDGPVLTLFGLAPRAAQAAIAAQEEIA